MSKPYQFLALGGTFDHFHRGHQSFIQFAALLADQLIIGVTSDQMATKKSWPQSLQDHAERRRSVQDYCRSLNQPCKIVELTDAVGNTLSDQRIQALAVTTETEAGGKHINQLRKARHLDPLPLHIWELLSAEDGAPLHSDRIRAGECSREGTLFISHFRKPIVLNNTQRQKLKQPLGTLVDQQIPPNGSNQTILIGDSTIETFVKNGWNYQVGIYDLHVQRQPATGYTTTNKPNYEVSNPAGTIQPDLAAIIEQVYKDQQSKPIHIKVEGEEDLAAVPSILLAPLGTHVYYGQPNQGLVHVEVTEEVKSQLSW